MLAVCQHLRAGAGRVEMGSRSPAADWDLGGMGSDQVVLRRGREGMGSLSPSGTGSPMEMSSRRRVVTRGPARAELGPGGRVEGLAGMGSGQPETSWRCAGARWSASRRAESPNERIAGSALASTRRVASLIFFYAESFKKRFHNCFSSFYVFGLFYSKIVLNAN